MVVRKSDGTSEVFDREKLGGIIRKTYKSAGIKYERGVSDSIINSLYIYDGIMCSSIRKQLEERFAERDEKLFDAYVNAKDRKKRIRDFVREKKEFIERYKKSDNTANATVDDNSNVSSKNIGILNAEIHKSDNIQISRGMVMDKLKELYPDFKAKNYIKDLEHHIIYKHDESSFAGAISPYCVSITMYPFLTNGIKALGGLSAAPKNIDSFCGMYVNLIFTVASQFAGAVAASETLLYFTYFAKKEWGEDFWETPDKEISVNCNRNKTIRSQIRQYFQQIVYSINQPAASRGMQSAFVNFSYFDKCFFEGMFGDFYFPDGTKPDWESLDWVQREFMMWFNEERTKTMLTFPVESFALVYKDGKFLDEKSAEFVAEEYARGHSFFTYISDTVDSLSSCCFSKDQKVLWKSELGGEIKTTTFEELFENRKDKVYVFYDGSWNVATPIRLQYDGEMFEVTIDDDRKMVVTDNHLHVTNEGDIRTDKLNYSHLILAYENSDSLENTSNSIPQYHKISNIRKLDNEKYVYCVECDNNEKPYFTLGNGIVTHNCRLKNKIQTKEFNFTNGNMGVQTGSKSVITINLNRIIQDYFIDFIPSDDNISDANEKKISRFKNSKIWFRENKEEFYVNFTKYLNSILDRVYKYHTAYNELLWDMYDANLLGVYKAGFIDLNKQYLTIGINGLNQAAEFVGIECRDNELYSEFCQRIFSDIKEQNQSHKVTDGKHKITFNTECVPAESLAIKNYNWDKEDGYWVPDDTNLYASYIYKPNDKRVSMLEKIRMHGGRYIGDYLDGGSAAHLNSDSHLSKEQYAYLLKYAADNGCQYLTWNIPNCECEDCHYISKTPFSKCPRCGSKNVSMWDRVIGYLTKVRNWSEGRQIEQKTRVYEHVDNLK